MARAVALTGTVTGKPQDFAHTAGEDVTITVTMNPATSLSGWTLSFTTTEDQGSALITKTTSSGITVTDATNGIFTVTLAAADTSALPGSYGYRIRRTDSGQNTLLAYGTHNVL